MEETKATQPGVSQDAKKRPTYFALNSAKLTGAVEQGTAPCLPGKSGAVKQDAVRCAETGAVYHGANQILAQMYLKEQGSRDTKICTWDQAKKAKTFIKAGAKGFPLTVYNAETKESKAYHYFPASEAASPDSFKTPSRTPPGQPKTPVIECKDSDPAKYLGRYFTALQLGSEFHASMQVQQAFQKNFVDAARNAEHPLGKPFEICNAASKECREIIKGMYKTEWVQAKRQENDKERQVSREQKPPEKTHSRSKGGVER